jgi:GTP-binding protein HflX
VFRGDNEFVPETAVLVGVISQLQTQAEAQEYLAELAFLAETAGANTVRIFTQNLSQPDKRTFVGTGKLQEIVDYVEENEVDMVIFDDELSPGQLRNLERVLLCKIIDRANLILDIFAARARTAQAKTQVELAQSQYLLPRLTRMWTHLSKQKGGIGMKGPGEKEIETDRRAVRDRIAFLREKLREIDKINTTQRKNRQEIIRIALVGYTNVGKSTLMNLLAKADVFAENKLFATLDATVRKVVIDTTPFLLSDTVGFIRKLPHHLVEAFKSTLDEVREADMLLHVVDASHPNFEGQMQIVHQTLHDIGAGEKPTMIIFNKIDKLPHENPDKPDYLNILDEAPELTIESLMRSYNAKERPSVFVSATDATGIADFKTKLALIAQDLWQERYPYIAPNF